jgi:ketosteroid isomerase-like protein
MKNSLCRMVVTASVLLTIACNSTTTESTEAAASNAADSSTFSIANARTGIDAQNMKFMEAIKKGDSAGIAALYTQDGLVMPSNHEAVPKEGIASLIGSMMKTGVKEIKLSTDDLSGNADMIAETGKYEILVDGQKSVDKGKYIVIWKPVDGTWKMYRDIFNSNVPMPPGK